MTALEFEDDDEGVCIGYARILKTPQKERRVKLKPLLDLTTATTDAENAELIGNNELMPTDLDPINLNEIQQRHKDISGDQNATNNQVTFIFIHCNVLYHIWDSIGNC